MDRHAVGTAGTAPCGTGVAGVDGVPVDAEVAGAGPDVAVDDGDDPVEPQAPSRSDRTQALNRRLVRRDMAPRRRRAGLRFPSVSECPPLACDRHDAALGIDRRLAAQTLELGAGDL